MELVVEPVLCLHKQEATEVNSTQHQGENLLREIQFQGKMENYTGTLNFMHAIVMEFFSDQCPDKKTKAINLAIYFM